MDFCICLVLKMVIIPCQGIEHKRECRGRVGREKCETPKIISLKRRP